MIFVSWAFLLCVPLVRSGFVDVQEDRLVRVDPEESPWNNDTALLNPDPGPGRSLAVPDSKDLLLPVMASLVLKIFSVTPLIFAFLGWLAGLGLATGKLALLLSAGLNFYQYFSQSSVVIPTMISTKPGVTKNFWWDNPTVGAGTSHDQLSHEWYQPQAQEDLFQRDRSLHTRF